MRRKSTHTDRLFDQLSHNPNSQKAATIKTFTTRANPVPHWVRKKGDAGTSDTPDSLLDENRYLERVFNKTNCNADFIWRNTQPTYWSWRNESEKPDSHTCYYNRDVKYFTLRAASETILRHAVLESVVHERSPRTHNYGTTLTGPAIEVKEKDEPNLDLQWFTRSNALTAKLPILVIRKLIRGWLTRDERREMVMPIEHRQLTNYPVTWDLVNA